MYAIFIEMMDNETRSGYMAQALTKEEMLDGLYKELHEWHGMNLQPCYIFAIENNEINTTIEKEVIDYCSAALVSNDLIKANKGV